MATLYVRAKPASKKETPPVWQMQPDGKEALVVAVSAPAVDGKANEALCKRVAALLGVPKSLVQITAGHTAKIKRMEIEGVSEADLAALGNGVP